jgi:hypothetical protein
MDGLTIFLGAAAVAAGALSLRLSAPPAPARGAARGAALDLVLAEARAAEARIRSLLPFALELLAAHEAARALKRDAGPLPLAALSRALDARLAELDEAHWAGGGGGGGGAAAVARALAAAGGAPEARAALAAARAAHPLAAPPARVLAAARAIADAEVAAHGAAVAAAEAEGAALGGEAFARILSAHLAAAGAAPGSRSLAAAVLRDFPEFAPRAALWAHIVGAAFAAEAAGEDAAARGFKERFFAVAEAHKAALRDLGLDVA